MLLYKEKSRPIGIKFFDPYTEAAKSSQHRFINNEQRIEN
ncbi:hypothetical protein OIU77_015913 [Salix suchowensis]|uniref:Uncharacterized protein n=1 Tax=Salix suchowensis TaxID=1278906 RepID=A0ABQ8ZIL9_9ROSI|nr:hypothetical protein OIU77_015913 [Salix suchowensis]